LRRVSTYANLNTYEHNDAGTVTISVRTSRDTKEQLAELAENMGRSTNYLVDEAITAYLKENAWQVKAIGEAVAQADAGGPFVSWEDTKRWIDSLGTDHELPPPEATIRR
jgi:RHH-type rel operon transcriptional repressor/antitoxin RelB